MSGSQKAGRGGGSENGKDQGQAESNFVDSGAGVHVVVSPADEATAPHVSIRAQEGVAPSASDSGSLRGREVPGTGTASYNGRAMRILDPQAFRRETRAQVEEEGRMNESNALKAQVEELKGSVEALKGVVQVQTGEIGALKSTVETLITTVGDLKMFMTQRAEQGNNNTKPFVVSAAAGAVAVQSPISLQEKQMLILVSAADTSNPSTLGSLGADIVETKGGTAAVVPLPPPDNQQKESMLESIEFLADLPPTPSSAAKAAIHRNLEELYVNAAEGTSADCDDHKNSKVPDSVLHSDHEETGSNVNANATDEQEPEVLQDCIFCAKVFSKEERLYEHIKAHIGERSVSAQQSNKVSRSKRSSAEDGGLSVQATSTNHDEQKSSSAEEVAGSSQQDKVSKSKPRRYNYDHIKVISTNPTLYQCVFCEKKFKTRRWRKQHEVCLNELKNMNFIYEKCSLGFTKKAVYETHLRVHSGLRPFPCRHCDRRFAQDTNLKRHVNAVHLGEKPHCCPQCGKGFSQMVRLQDHLRTHTGETPYLCDQCDKAFSDRSNLSRHLRRMHSSERQ